MTKSTPEMVALRKEIQHFIKIKNIKLGTFSGLAVGFSLRPFMAGETKNLHSHTADKIRNYIKRNLVDRVANLTTQDLIRMGVKCE